MENPSGYVKGNPQNIAARVAGWLLALGLCAAILFPVFAVPGHGHRPSCVSHLKQVTLSMIFYSSDYDDRLPPFFTFDGEESTKQFMKVTLDYSKNPIIYLCPQDNGATSKSQEGLPGKMSYVHPLALKGLIPDFHKGRRTILVDNSFSDPGTIVYLRDPIRSDPEGDTKNIHSPHKEGFSVSYLDGHAKRIEHLNVNTEL